MDLAAVGTDVERVIVTEEQLRSKVAELAARIDVDYKDRDLLLVGVLKGAIMAMGELGGVTLCESTHTMKGTVRRFDFKKVIEGMEKLHLLKKGECAVDENGSLIQME